MTPVYRVPRIRTVDFLCVGSKNELIEGIEMFWDSVYIHKCQRYIDHLKKVLPRAIEVAGDQTVYSIVLAKIFPTIIL